MPEIRKRRSRSPAPKRKPTPEFTWEDLATATLPVLACLLGGATEKWAEGIIVALVGLMLLLNPPRFSLGWGFHVILFGLLGCAAIGFLPASWFHQPAWRQALTDDFGIALPSTLSSQPWITAGCLVSFFAGLCWFYYVTGQEVEVRAARRQLRIFAVGVILLAGLAVGFYFMTTALPFWHNQRGFGPFPNRNQTANLLGLTAIIIVACGHDEIRRGRKRWILWLAGLAVVVTALVLNFSRAGIAILFVGSAVWFAVLILRSRSVAKIAVGGSVLLALVTAVLLFGGATLERFNLKGSGSEVSNDFRWLIFKDTSQLIQASPWPGVGLGNFRAVFPIFRDASIGQSVALHPESDWLWLASEMGWAAVILILAGAVLLGRRVFPFVEGTNQWFRLAALIAAVLFALHAIVDVGGHRVGTAYAGVFLFALALRRPLPLPATIRFINTFRVLGVVLFIIGMTWLVSVYRSIPLPGSVGVDLEKRLAETSNAGGLFTQTIEYADAGLRWAPLDWQLYFLRALGKVGAKRPSAEALEDFRRARFLEPNSYEVPYQEGVAWITRDPLLAITAWQESLRRAGLQRVDLYGRMLSSATQSSPAVRRMLEEFGGTQPDLALAFLERARGADFAAALKKLLEHDPSLAMLTPAQQAKLFDLWTKQGDLNLLTAFLDNHPEMLTTGWRGITKQKASAGDFRGAYEMAIRFGVRPAFPQLFEDAASIDQLQKAIFADPNDYQSAFALYQLQIKAGQTDDALNTVRRLTEKPSAPPYFHFLEAESWAAKGNWERAWKAFEAYAGEPAK